MPMQNQIKNGEGDGKKEAQPAPKELEKKYEWARGVKKRERPKGKRTDVAPATPGNPGSAANVLPNHMDEEMRASRQEIKKAFLDFGNGFSTETELRTALTNMGAELTDEEVSELVRAKQASRQEIESAFLNIGYGFFTEAELRIALLNMGEGLTDEAVSDLVRHIRENGGGV